MGNGGGIVKKGLFQVENEYKISTDRRKEDPFPCCAQLTAECSDTMVTHLRERSERADNVDSEPSGAKSSDANVSGDAKAPLSLPHTPFFLHHCMIRAAVRIP